MASSSHITDEAGRAAESLRMLEKASGGRVDEEDEVVSFAPDGGGGSVAGGCWAGVSCVEAVKMGVEARARLL